MNFYVYEHWRLDIDTCFYVGKGSGGRAYSRRSRNIHWKNIVCKLDRIGFGYEVRLVATGLTEEEAFNLEIERILFWRDKVDLANRTDGGEGFSGGRHSSESKEKISIGSKKTAADNREKNRQRMLGEANPFYGKTHSPETIARIKEKLTGRKLPPRPPRSDEHKSAISATMKKKGIRPPSRKGISPTEEDRKKKSESIRAYWAARKAKSECL
jgi:hypothetical protein